MAAEMIYPSSTPYNNDINQVQDQQSNVMENELKSLQTKIMDLENKLSFTHDEPEPIQIEQRF